MSKEKERSTSLTLNLSAAYRAPSRQRAESAMRSIRRAIMNRFKVSEVNVDPQINEMLWRRSKSSPPRMLKVRVRVEDDVAYVERHSE
jgi:ribosomal protein L31E